MARKLGETQNDKSSFVIHLVSIGRNISHASEIIKEYRGNYVMDDSYLSVTESDELPESLGESSKTNVLFLNCAPCFYNNLLEENASYILAKKPLVVVPNDYKMDVSISNITKFDIKFVPFWGGKFYEVPEYLESLLREREQRRER